MKNRNGKRIVALITVLCMLLCSSALAKSLFVPNDLAQAYNAAIEPTMNAMLKNDPMVKEIVPLMTIKYGSTDGQFQHYTTDDTTFMIGFEGSDRYSESGMVLAYANISDNSLLRNLPMFPLMTAVYTIYPDEDLGALLDWANGIEEGSRYIGKHFIMEGGCVAHDYVSVTFIPK